MIIKIPPNRSDRKLSKLHQPSRVSRTLELSPRVREKKKKNNHSSQTHLAKLLADQTREHPHRELKKNPRQKWVSEKTPRRLVQRPGTNWLSACTPVSCSLFFSLSSPLPAHPPGVGVAPRAPRRSISTRLREWNTRCFVYRANFDGEKREEEKWSPTEMMKREREWGGKSINRRSRICAWVCDARSSPGNRHALKSLRGDFSFYHPWF